jgi:hypothetical protein
LLFLKGGRSEKAERSGGAPQKNRRGKRRMTRKEEKKNDSRIRIGANTTGEYLRAGME